MAKVITRAALEVMLQESKEANAQLVQELESAKRINAEKDAACERLKQDAEKRAQFYRQEAEERGKTISAQATRISELTAERDEAESKLQIANVKHEKLVDELCEHMGWFRRWTWDLKHANNG